MASTLTLDEAAEKLGLSPAEFKRRLREDKDWKSLKSFRDGPTLRFRTVDIEELARSLGAASDPGVTLGSAVPLTDSSEEIPITQPKSSLKPPPKAADAPLLFDDTDADDYAIPMDPTPASQPGSAKGDSDVRLDLTPSAKSPADITEEIALDLPSVGGSGVLQPPSSVKLSNPKSAKLTGPGSARIPSPAGMPTSDEGSSEFELSLDPDSDSFELTLNNDSSEEVALGNFSPDERGSRSGIRLDQPADGGLSLEKGKIGKPQMEDDSDIDFDLSLDAPTQTQATNGPGSVRRSVATDSDSEFELSLDDNSGVTDGLVGDLNAEQNQGDIFETDFELPVVSQDESGSEVVAMDSSDTDLADSDFEVAIEDSDAPGEDDSASQVILVDDDEADAVVLSDDDAAPITPSRKKRGLISQDDDDVMVGEESLEEGASASQALRGVRRGEDDDDTPIRSAAPQPPRWGPLPALFLLPCLIVVTLGSLMAFEMVRGQWGYTQPSKPSDALVRGVATNLGFKTSD